MEGINLKWSFLLIIISCEDILPFQLNAYKSAEKAILGDNKFSISCAYTLPDNEQLSAIYLKRKRDSDTNFVRIVNFYSRSKKWALSYIDTTLESRTEATKEDNNTVSFIFNKIECNDSAKYACVIDTKTKHRIETVSVIVKAKALFSKNGRISYSPQSNIQEGENVTFICSGDVGKEPVGFLGWYYYLQNDTSNLVNVSNKAVPTAPQYQPNTCSFTRTTTLQLTLTRHFNNVILRCTVHQDTFDQCGEGYVETINIPVYYPPRISPMDDVVIEKAQVFNLSCHADSYPTPEYSWILPNGSKIHGSTIVLLSVIKEDTGVYMCIVFNTFKGVKHITKETVYIHVMDLESSSVASETGEETSNVGDFIGLGVGIGVFVVVVVGCIVFAVRHKILTFYRERNSIVVKSFYRGRRYRKKEDGQNLNKNTDEIASFERRESSMIYQEIPEYLNHLSDAFEKRIASSGYGSGYLVPNPKARMETEHETNTEATTSACVTDMSEMRDVKIVQDEKAGFRLTYTANIELKMPLNAMNLLYNVKD